MRIPLRAPHSAIDTHKHTDTRAGAHHSAPRVVRPAKTCVMIERLFLVRSRPDEEFNTPTTDTHTTDTHTTDTHIHHRHTRTGLEEGEAGHHAEDQDGGDEDPRGVARVDLTVLTVACWRRRQRVVEAEVEVSRINTCEAAGVRVVRCA